MNESGIYTEADLKPFQERLGELKAIIKSGHGFAGTMEGAQEEVEEREEGLTKLLLAKWDDCGESRFLTRDDSTTDDEIPRTPAEQTRRSNRPTVP